MQPRGTNAIQPSLPFDLGSPRYQFVRHPRARRYVIRVVDHGTVRVTVPRGGSKREAEAFAEREHRWIEKQRQRMEAERERRERRAIHDERSTGGREPAPAGLGRIDGLSAEEQRALRVRATRDLPRRLLELAAQHGLTVTRVSVRNQRSRWGSCNRTGHICLNWRLVQMPDLVRDYVLLHELMHLKRLDHSPKFWKLVAEVCPDFRSARAWLKAFSRGVHVVES
jgi:predicted metal-dependent hydrolase